MPDPVEPSPTLAEQLRDEVETLCECRSCAKRNDVLTAAADRLEALERVAAAAEVNRIARGDWERVIAGGSVRGAGFISGALRASQIELDAALAALGEGS